MIPDRRLVALAPWLIVAFAGAAAAQSDPATADSGANAEAPSPAAESATTTTSAATPKTTTKKIPAPDALTAERTPVQALSEHFLGSASRAVRFDWRGSPVAFGLIGGEVLERNNFAQFRLGGLARKAFGDVLLEGSVSYFYAFPTPSSELLALTPFRQAGRPPHFELDVDVGYALAEGVVTPLASFIPPAEMALVACGGARYLVYPEGLFGRPLTDVGLDLISPKLSEGERAKIEPNALEGMFVDPARFHTVVGLSLDVYFQPGILVSPRAVVTVPLLAGVTETNLGFFWELGLVLGYAL